MRILGKALSGIINIFTLLGGIAVLLMMAQIVLDVFLRNIFGISIPGTTTIVANYWMVIVAYLPLAMTERLDQHISVDLLVVRFSERVRGWIIAGTWLLCAVVAAVLTFVLFKEALKKMSYGTFDIELGMRIVTWPAHFAVPIGFALYALIVLYRLGIFLTGAPNGMVEPSRQPSEAIIETRGAE